MRLRQKLNRKRLTWLDCETLAQLTGGAWINQPAVDWRPNGICFDKEWEPQSLVIPKGQPFRHGFDLANIDQAQFVNCALLVADRLEGQAGTPQLVVPSIYQAVEALAISARSRYTGIILAVTGSVGKSSTCHLLSHVLRKHGTCNKLRRGVNTKSGVIAQVVNLQDECFAVLEMSVGEGLSQASQIVEPQLAILTAIAPAHLTYAGPLPRLADLKASIFSGLASNGAAILNRDIPYFERVHSIAKRFTNTAVTYGEHADAEVRLLDYDPSRRLVSADIRGDRIHYRLGIGGRHMAINSLAVLSALSFLGLDYRDGASRLEKIRPLHQRGVPYCVAIGGKKLMLIDDSHNANPASMIAAMQLLASWKPASLGRRVLVLADMLELGPGEIAYHRGLADAISEAKIDKVHVMGELMGHLWKALPSHVRGRLCDSREGLREAILADTVNGDVVLFKGSHASMLWRLVHDLRDLDDVNKKSFGWRRIKEHIAHMGRRKAEAR